MQGDLPSPFSQLTVMGSSSKLLEHRREAIVIVVVGAELQSYIGDYGLISERGGPGPGPALHSCCNGRRMVCGLCCVWWWWSMVRVETSNR